MCSYAGTRVFFRESYKLKLLMRNVDAVWLNDEMSVFSFRFVVLWTCGSAWQNATGGFSVGHSWGWQSSFMGATNLSSDGYASPDDSARCFIGFDNFSIWYRNETQYQNYNMGDFIIQLYNYLLQGYTIRQSLNLATTNTYNPYLVPSFANSSLYLGYWMNDPRNNYQPVECWMRIRGDGDLILPN